MRYRVSALRRIRYAYILEVTYLISMAPQKTEKVSVSIPLDILIKMDQEIKKQTYATRSHCVRVALQKLLESKGKLDHYS